MVGGERGAVTPNDRHVILDAFVTVQFFSHPIVYTTHMLLT